MSWVFVVDVHRSTITVSLSLLSSATHKILLHSSWGQYLCSELRLQEEKHLSQWSNADDPPCRFCLALFLLRGEHRKNFFFSAGQSHGAVGSRVQGRQTAVTPHTAFFQDTGCTFDMCPLTLPMMLPPPPPLPLLGLSPCLTWVMVYETGWEREGESAVTEWESRRDTERKIFCFCRDFLFAMVVFPSTVNLRVLLFFSVCVQICRFLWLLFLYMGCHFSYKLDIKWIKWNIFRKSYSSALSCSYQI